MSVYAEKRYGNMKGKATAVFVVGTLPDEGDGECLLLALPFISQQHAGRWTEFTALDAKTQGEVAIRMVKVPRSQYKGLRRQPLRTWGGDFLDFGKGLAFKTEDPMDTYSGSDKVIDKSFIMDDDEEIPKDDSPMVFPILTKPAMATSLDPPQISPFITLQLPSSQAAGSARPSPLGSPGALGPAPPGLGASSAPTPASWPMTPSANPSAIDHVVPSGPEDAGLPGYAVALAQGFKGLQPQQMQQQQQALQESMAAMQKQTQALLLGQRELRSDLKVRSPPPDPKRKKVARFSDDLEDDEDDDLPDLSLLAGTQPSSSNNDLKKPTLTAALENINKTQELMIQSLMNLSINGQNVLHSDDPALGNLGLGGVKSARERELYRRRIHDNPESIYVQRVVAGRPPGGRRGGEHTVLGSHLRRVDPQGALRRPPDPAPPLAHAGRDPPAALGSEERAPRVRQASARPNDLLPEGHRHRRPAERPVDGRVGVQLPAADRRERSRHRPQRARFSGPLLAREGGHRQDPQGRQGEEVSGRRVSGVKSPLPRGRLEAELRAIAQKGGTLPEALRSLRALLGLGSTPLSSYLLIYLSRAQLPKRPPSERGKSSWPAVSPFSFWSDRRS